MPSPSIAVVAGKAAAVPVAIAEVAAPAAVPDVVQGDQREQRKLAAQTRQQHAERTRPLKKELEQIDKRMAVLSATRAELEHKLTQPLPPSEIAECGKRLKAGNDETSQLEERWLEISAELEEISVASPS